MYIVIYPEKAIILSQLKNSYPCLTQNPPDIAVRILLGLEINPLNDFHMVTWNSFNKLRKLATLRQAKNEGRKFMVNYIMTTHNKLKKDDFWAIVGALLRKLETILNPNNLERLIERVRECGDEWLPE